MDNSTSVQFDKEQHAATTRRIMATHEKDERWAAVDDYAAKHLFTPNSPDYSHINHAINLSEEKGLPGIEVPLLQGKWLQTQIQLINAKHVLEVGTLGGISSIMMALSGPDVKVSTIEIDPEHVDVARQAIAHADLTERVEVFQGAGMEVLPRLRGQVKAGERPVYDLVFIDADKPNNLNYFNEAMQMVRSRACIIVDNVVRQGRLADDKLAESDVSVKGARQVIEAAARDERVLNSTLLQLVSKKDYDGMFVVVVK